MKNVYINFKDGYACYDKDFEEGNVIYNAENNIVAISNVKEVIYNGEAIEIHSKGKGINAYWIKAIKSITIN